MYGLWSRLLSEVSEQRGVFRFVRVAMISHHVEVRSSLLDIGHHSLGSIMQAADYPGRSLDYTHSIALTVYLSPLRLPSTIS